MSEMKHHATHHGSGGAVYGLGFVGALVYYWQHAATFWQGIVGLFKAILWPAYMVFHLLGFLNM